MQNSHEGTEHHAVLLIAKNILLNNSVPDGPKDDLTEPAPKTHPTPYVVFVRDSSKFKQSDVLSSLEEHPDFGTNKRKC